MYRVWLLLTMMTKSTKDERRGGPREHSGAKTRYPHKDRVTSIALTEDARRILDLAASAHAASMSDIICYLLIEYGRKIKHLPPLATAG
jgi:hypothetical protein